MYWRILKQLKQTLKIDQRFVIIETFLLEKGDSRKKDLPIAKQMEM